MHEFDPEYMRVLEEMGAKCAFVRDPGSLQSKADRNYFNVTEALTWGDPAVDPQIAVEISAHPLSVNEMVARAVDGDGTLIPCVITSPGMCWAHLADMDDLGDVALAQQIMRDCLIVQTSPAEYNRGGRYHVIDPNPAAGETEWAKGLGRALMAGADAKWVGLALRRGFSALRVGSCRRNPTIPRLVTP